MDETRALLDQLMGRERDVPLDKRTNRKRHFTDDDVCKFHLVGLCPYALFNNTKSDLGEHPNGEEDNDDMKEMYEARPLEERERYGYERQLLRCLEELVAGVDRKVERNRERCNLENSGSGIPEDALQELLKLEVGIKEKTEESEKLAEDGEIDEAQARLEEVASMQQKKNSIEKQYTSIKTVKRNIVCEVSGNIMSSADNEERIMCHFQGKQYLGWKACREKVKELREKFSGGARRRDSPLRSRNGGSGGGGIYGPSENGGSGPPRGDSRDRSRGDRHRNRSRDRDRQRDRSRDKDRRRRSRSDSR
ncbi:hypothetical protein JKP88DRAFT_25649, partial [Tribonema minus]